MIRTSLKVTTCILTLSLSSITPSSANKSPCCGEVSKATMALKQHKTAPEGMVHVPSGTFMMGGHDKHAKPDELPVHEVRVDEFYMDQTQVTNKQFEVFVKETGYKTTAEKPVDWEQLKLQVPPNTPKPPAETLAPGSLVFTPPDHPVNLRDSSQWWTWTNGADWRRPLGPHSEQFGSDHPVVHVSHEDATAYCQWAHKRLPTEAEREWAARGGLHGKSYPWGDEEVDEGKLKANIWHGTFPHINTKKDQKYWTTAVKSFPPNGYGLYDMAGNVWEWTSDLYDANYYESQKAKGLVVNPHNTERSYDPDDPHAKKYVIRGGSYLCHNSYCRGYRVSARMKTSGDTSLAHVGFRCVQSCKK
jgi:formylglycine-generating enzyme